jgi:hypothetical protein
LLWAPCPLNLASQVSSFYHPSQIKLLVTYCSKDICTLS